MSINGLTGCRSMLSTNEYVHVFAFDFSKAFDTAWHSALMSKLATICNYLTAFTTGCETFSPVDTIARDTPVICQPSLASKPLWYRAPVLDRHPRLSQPLICTRAQRHWQPAPSPSLGHRGSEVERMAFGPLGTIRSLGAKSLEGSRPTDLGGASWVAASAHTGYVVGRSGAATSSIGTLVGRLRGRSPTPGHV